jgi:hypothetical protein
MPDIPLRVEVEAQPAHQALVARATASLLTLPVVKRDFPGADLWLVAYDVLEKQGPSGPLSGEHGEANPPFVGTVQDMDSGRVLEVRGLLDQPDTYALEYTSRQYPPTDDELAWAVGEIGPPEGAEVYRPLPPLANIEHPDGTVDRVIVVGLRAPEGTHRLVGVRTSDGEVFEPPPGVVVPAGTGEHGVPRGPGCAPVTGDQQARVRVLRGEELLWDLVVVRPSASSGANGSGVELRSVDYLGKRVLGRGHVPILNLEYEGGDGVIRLWQTSEACFEATGEDPVAGFRLCSEPPRTIVGAEAEAGDFRGVALWLDGDDLVVLSQVEAGWHRYVSEWRLSADGRIRPRMRFGAVRNPATGRPHVHHAYWRLDFDVPDALNNAVQEFNDPPVMGFGRLQTVRYETRRPRSAANQRSWQVRDDRFGRAYVLVPGAEDGEATAFGVGDVWVLRYSELEIDDGEGITTDPVRARAQIDRFLNGDPVHREDLVLWYAAHSRNGVAVGPDLNPRFWRPEPEAQAEPAEPLDLSADR